MGDEDSNFEKKQVVEQQSHLSDDLIIEEILTRLPVKSILRFKSVSKQWYSTLSSSDFAKAHLMKSPLAYPSAPVNTLFIKDHNNCCCLFSYEDDQVSGNFEDYLVRLDPEFEEKYSLQLTGSCNGLVCLNPISDIYFILWNPATRKMHKYETDVHLRRIESVDDYKFIRHVICGFWYASFVDDYKFIRILKRTLGTDDDTNYIVHIFSLRENKWTRFDFDFGHDFFATGRAILANDRLYWPVFALSAGHIVLSFDLVVERFDIVKLDYMNLGVMGGCLSMYDSGSGDKDDKLMHIYESHGVILKSIDFPKGLRLEMGSQMIGFTRTGKCFVTGTLTDGVSGFENRMLGVVDTGTKILQYTTLFRFDEMIDIARYVPSLVSPFPFEKLSTT